MFKFVCEIWIYKKIICGIGIIIGKNMFSVKVIRYCEQKKIKMNQMMSDGGRSTK